MTRLVRNPNGQIHSVSDEHYDEHCSIVLQNGRRVLLPGWEDVDEATARKEHPTLFGAADPTVRAGMTPIELASEASRREMLNRLGEDADVDAEERG